MTKGWTIQKAPQYKRPPSTEEIAPGLAFCMISVGGIMGDMN